MFDCSYHTMSVGRFTMSKCIKYWSTQLLIVFNESWEFRATLEMILADTYPNSCVNNCVPHMYSRASSLINLRMRGWATGKGITLTKLKSGASRQPYSSPQVREIYKHVKQNDHSFVFLFYFRSPSRGMKKHGKPSFKFAKRDKFYKPKEKVNC